MFLFPESWQIIFFLSWENFAFQILWKPGLIFPTHSKLSLSYKIRFCRSRSGIMRSYFVSIERTLGGTHSASLHKVSYDVKFSLSFQISPMASVDVLSFTMKTAILSLSMKDNLSTKPSEFYSNSTLSNFLSFKCTDFTFPSQFEAIAKFPFCVTCKSFQEPPTVKTVGSSFKSWRL